MKIQVVGFDPSMNGWGVASAGLDLETGILETLELHVMEPEKESRKQVRVNSVDLGVAEQLSQTAFSYAERAKVVFVEVPVGSQSASGMKAYGICVGILGSLRTKGIQLIEVTATEVKLALSGDRNASKRQMIAEAVKLYPEANWPRYASNGKTYRKGDIAQKAEHAADALGAIYAGVNTPVFQNLRRLHA